MIRILALTCLTACASQTTDTSGDKTEGTPPAGAGEVELTTRDDVRIVGDYVPASSSDVGFVLLHMIPPNNDRTGYTNTFVDALTELGHGVINIDRRGAGDSGGVPEEAYLGPTGKFDVEAAVLHLAAEGHTRIAIVGASNGTTSLLDYTVWAGSEGLPEPSALVFMTGGTYTESQNAMTTMPKVPAAFTYSTAEAGWSEEQMPLDPGGWEFLEYPNGAHGTNMFDAAPDVVPQLAGFFSTVL